MVGGEGGGGVYLTSSNWASEGEIRAKLNYSPAITESPQNPDAQPIRTVLPCKGFDMNRFC